MELGGDIHSILLDTSKSTKLRLDCKVSAIILHAARDLDDVWPTHQDCNLSLIAAKERGKKKAVGKKAAAKTSSELQSSSSDSDEFESQQQPPKTQPPKTQPQPEKPQPSISQTQYQSQNPQPTRSHSLSPSLSSSKPSKWKIIPHPRENVSSASPSPRNLPPLTNKNTEPTSVSADIPLETELSSVSPKIPTEVGLTPASEKADDPPHRELSVVPEENEETDDVTLTGYVSFHSVLFRSFQIEKDNLSQ